MKEINMNIYINGQPIRITHDQATILHALQQFLTNEQLKQTFAAALNGEFVSKTSYQDIVLNNGDSIDVLFPIQGG